MRLQDISLQGTGQSLAADAHGVWMHAFFLTVAHGVRLGKISKSMETEMAEISLTQEQLDELMRQLMAAKEGKGRLMDVIMPNGKPLAECTGSYAAEIFETMGKMGLMMWKPEGKQ